MSDSRVGSAPSGHENLSRAGPTTREPQPSASSVSRPREPRSDRAARRVITPTISTKGITSGRATRPIRRSQSVKDVIGWELRAHRHYVKLAAPGRGGGPESLGSSGRGSRRRIDDACPASLRPWTMLLTGLALWSCAPSRPVFAPRSDPSGPVVLYVSAEGRDEAAGTQDAPLGTLLHALEGRRADVIRLLPGTHRGDDVYLSRSVVLEGSPTATIAAHVFVGSGEVRISDLTLLEGLGIGLADGVEVSRVRIEPGERDEAISIHRSRVRLSSLALTGGFQAALQVTASTVTASALIVDGDRGLRSVRIDGGRLSLRDSKVSAGSIASVQATGSSTVTVRSSQLGPSPGSGLVVLDGASGFLVDSRVFGTGRFGVLGRRARLFIETSTLAEPGVAALGASGAEVRVRGGLFEAGEEAAVVATAFEDLASRVALEGLRIVHGDRLGVSVSRARVSAREVELVGLRPDLGPAAVEAVEAPAGRARAVATSTSGAASFSGARSASAPGGEIPPGLELATFAGERRAPVPEEAGELPGAESLPDGAADPARLALAMDDAPVGPARGEEPSDRPGGPYALGRAPAVLAHGEGARLRFDGVRFFWPAGSAVLAEDDAEVELQRLEVEAPGGSALHFAGIRSSPVVLEAIGVRGCATGAGVWARDVGQLSMKRLDVQRCPAGGVVASEGTLGELHRGRILGGLHGVAAFGGARLLVAGSTLAGDVWSAFASCAGEASVLDAGGNHLLGRAALCP